MSFGQRMAQARKDKDLKQKQLGDATGLIRDMIGKYERDEIKPSIEVAAKIADALDTSLDYLVRGISPATPGDGTAALSPQVVKHAVKIEGLSSEDKEHVFAVIEAFTVKSNTHTHNGK